MCKFYYVLLVCVMWASCAFAETKQNSDRGHYESLEIKWQYAELRKKLDESPEIKELKQKLVAAQAAYNAAVNEAISKENPALAEKYKSIAGSPDQLRGRRPEAATTSGYNQLSEEEKKQLFQARQQAMASEAVKAARVKRNSAKTEEERSAAESEYKSELRRAILEVDKDLEGLLNKLEGKLEGKKESPAKP